MKTSFHSGIFKPDSSGLIINYTSPDKKIGERKDSSKNNILPEHLLWNIVAWDNARTCFGFYEPFGRIFISFIILGI